MLLRDTCGITFWISLIPHNSSEIILLTIYFCQKLLQVGIFILINMNYD